VIQLANQLTENGIDVTLDKWDLKEGHDAIAFMEKMVADPEIKKVIVILDRSYAEKADARVDCFPTHAAFPKWQEGRHPHCHFRGLLRLHSRYGLPDCSAA
jgi:cobalamin-dependent methionine synthase I